MEIRDEHVDYAVVDRLRTMLVAPPATDFEVSLSYAFFCTILCWVLQHVRVDKDPKAIQNLSDDLAVEVAGALKKERASDLPWRCKLEITGAPNGEQGNELSTDDARFELSAFGLLKMLRDAMAHGDARKVTPIHDQAPHGSRILQGFELKLEWKRGEDFGTAQLFCEGIIRLGSRLAQQYCDALRTAAKDSHLAEDAERGVLEKPSTKKAA